MKKLAGLALALAFLPLLSACRSVPYTGRSQLLLISAADEKSLGLQAYQDVLKESKLSNDEEKTALVRRVGERLARAADKPDFQWEFNLLEDDKQVNAFCLPGGKVAVYTGILPVAGDEQGLAVVIGHEIAHALARHGGERLSQGMMAQFGGVALSFLLQSKPEQSRHLIAQAYGLGVGVGVLLPHSRRQESEADRIGLILMAKAGYDPAHALSFWQRMHEAKKGGGEGPLARYLGTHPTDKDRQEQIREWLPEAYRYRGAAKK